MVWEHKSSPYLEDTMQLVLMVTPSKDVGEGLVSTHVSYKMNRWRHSSLLKTFFPLS